MHLSTIFFDVGGTLIYPDMSRLAAPLLARVTPSAEDFAWAERAAKQGPLPQTGKGAASGSHAGPVNRSHWYTFFATLLDRLPCGQELLPELVARAGDSGYWSCVDPAAASTLRALQTSYRLAVISNADGRIEAVLNRGGLGGFFEKIIDSGCLGFEKPDARIFRAGLERMGVTPAESLYVGDVYHVDYEGARGAGMNALLVDPRGVYASRAVPCIASLGELPDWLAVSCRQSAACR
jgi:putative hydrolase of the HAD superfamily